MAEEIVNILNKIKDAKGEAYAKGLVDGVNLATKEKPEKSDDQPDA